MKNILPLIIALFISTSLFSQELAKNEVDEFTGHSIKQTEFERMNYSKKFIAYFRTSKINDQLYFDLKLMNGMGDVFSIDEGAELMFKMENEEITKLPNLKYTLTCNGCGAKGLGGSNAQGIQVSYLMTQEQYETLRNNKAVKIRIYTSDGYLEEDLQVKYYKKVQKGLALAG